MTWQCIVKVGAEGGSISLFGLLKPDGKWLYSLTRDERTLADLDLDELKYLSKTKAVQDWDAVTDHDYVRPSSMMMWERLCKK